MAALAAIMLGLAVAAGAAAPSQRSGYPMLRRCASPIARPEPRADYSAACIAWRTEELRRIAALPASRRIARVTELRARMGLTPGEGLETSPDGALVPSRR